MITNVGEDDTVRLMLRVREDDPARLDLRLTRDWLPYTDLNAARLILAFRQDELTYGVQSGTWRAWDGVVHRPMPEGEIDRIIAGAVTLWSDALQHIEDDYYARVNEDFEGDLSRAREAYTKEWKPWRAYRTRLYSTAGQDALRRMLQKLAGRDEEEFDADPAWLVVRNGVINVPFTEFEGTVDLFPHSHERLVSRVAAASWDPEAEAPEWRRFLETSLPDPVVRRYLQRWAGAALRGKPVDKGFVNLIGTTDSGKSVFVETIVRVLGDYARSVDSSTFILDRRGGGNPEFKLHELRGARVVGTGEPGKGKHLNDEVIKSLTGGDRQQSRTLYGKYVTWDPQCTIFISSNQPMAFDTSDVALLQRLKPVPFNVHFERDRSKPAERYADLELRDKLAEEHDGILRWMIEGLVDYARHGLGDEPAAVTGQRESMAVEMETPLQWLDEQLETGRVVIDHDAVPSHWLQVQPAYKSYRWWAEERGERPVGRQRFSAVIGRRHKAIPKSNYRFTGLLPTERWNEYGV